jgi:large subunit ribosomal protein L3
MPRGIGLLGRKVGMTQVFDADGRAVGGTVIYAPPGTITAIRAADRDGYAAVQVAFHEEPKAERRLSKAERGVFAKLGIPAHRIVTEFRPHPRRESPADLAVSSKLTVAVFKPGDRVDVQGTSKGRGFQGVVKRHGFRGGADTHGSMSHRAPGSIGASTDPGRTLRGTRMGGRHGNATTTIQNLEVLQVDEARNVVVLRGAVPGATGALLRLTPTVKRRAPRPPRLWVEVRDSEGAKTAAKKAPAAKK